jgi:hypothetical protein
MDSNDVGKQTNEATNSLVQEFCYEANSRSANQEINRDLFHLDAHYRVHKSPALVCILCRIDRFIVCTSNFISF